MNYEKFKAYLNSAELELLMRRWAMAPGTPPAEQRGLAKQAIINFVIKAIDECGSKKDGSDA